MKIVSTSKNYVIYTKSALDSNKNRTCTYELDNDKRTCECEDLVQAAKEEKLN